ncbi:MAG: SAM-dependent methyltransferase [Myxococcales bacterium]
MLAQLLPVLLVFAVITLLLLASLRALAITRVPVVSASEPVVDAALELLALKDGETFCEIGCGWGGVVKRARTKADVKAVGYELNPSVALVAALRNLPDANVRIRMSDARRSDFGGADAVYAFLMPHAMQELAEALETRLRPGARVLSVDFPIPDWTPVAQKRAGGEGQQVYLYVIGRHRPDAPAS